MKLKMLFIACLVCNATILVAQKGISNSTKQCTEAYLKSRVKELIYENINHDSPGVLKPDLSFAVNNGAVLNEMLNDSLKLVISQQITIEFKGCSIVGENFHLFSTSSKQNPPLVAELAPAK